MRRLVRFSCVWGFRVLIGLSSNSARADEEPSLSVESGPLDPGSASVPSSGTTEPAPAAILEAKGAFARGRAFEDLGKFPAAVEEFRRALAIKETPGLYYHLGFSLEGAGDPLNARLAYLRANEFGGKLVPLDVARALPQALARVEGNLATVLLSGLPEGAELLIDGRPTRFEEPLFLGPGVHQIEVKKAGYSSWKRVFRLQARQREKAKVALAPRSSLPGVAPAERSVVPSERGVESPARSIAVWSGVGLGVLGTGVGFVGVFLEMDASARAADARATLDAATGGSTSACVEPTKALRATCDQLKDAVADERTGSAIMMGGFVAAGVGVVGALGAHFLWPEGRMGLSGEWGAAGPRLSLQGSF